MIVVAKESSLLPKLTKYKSYKVLLDGNIVYSIYDDAGVYSWVNYRFFYSLDEYRELKINILIDEQV